MILIDASGLLAAIDVRQPEHATARRALEDAEPPFLLSPFVLAELDYFVLKRIGAHAETALLKDVAAGAYQLEAFDSADVAEANEIIQRYSELAIGLADASIVVLADRHDVSDLLTLDERHFRALRRGDGKHFRLLPI